MTLQCSFCIIWINIKYIQILKGKNKVVLLSICGVGEDSWESLGLQGDPTSPFWRRSVLNIHWKDWCWSWNSNTLATCCEEPTHWKRPWCWERLRAGREGADRGWDGWTASLTQWTWIWANSGRQWRTEKPGVLQFMGLQKVRHSLAFEQQHWVTNYKFGDLQHCPSSTLYLTVTEVRRPGRLNWILSLEEQKSKIEVSTLLSEGSREHTSRLIQAVGRIQSLWFSGRGFSFLVI